MNQSVNNAHEQLFAIAKSTRQLSKQSLSNADEINAHDSQARLLFNDIVKTVCLPHLASSKANLEKINLSTQLMTQYLWVLNKISLSISQPQAAASSAFEAVAEDLVRRTDKFELKVCATDDDQKVSVSINVHHSTATQSQVGCHLHLLLNNKCAVLSFNALKDNQSELLLNKGTQEYECLINEETKIHLS